MDLNTSGSNLGKRKSELTKTPKGKKSKAEGKEKSEWWQYYEKLYDEDEDDRFSDAEFTRMMLLDGCFILYFIEQIVLNNERLSRDEKVPDYVRFNKTCSCWRNKSRI